MARNEFGHILEQALVNADMTQARFAPLVEKTRNFISYLINEPGIPRIAPNSLRLICKVLNLDFNTMLAILKPDIADAIAKPWNKTSTLVVKAIEQEYIPEGLPPDYLRELAEWEYNQESKLTPEQIREKYQHDLKTRQELQVWEFMRTMTPEDKDTIVKVARSLSTEKENTPQT